MSKNALFLYDDKAETATLTPSTEQGLLVAENAQDFDVRKVWRTDDIDLETLELDFGLKIPLQTIGLVNHNMTVTGQIRVTVADDAGFAAPTYTALFTAWEPAYGLGDVGLGEDGWGGFPQLTLFNQFRPIRLIRLPADVQGRYLQLEFQDLDNTDGYLQFGKIMAGVGRQPEFNFSREWEHDWTDQGDQVDMEGGMALGREKGRYRTIFLPFNDLLRSELLGWIDDMKRICGTTRPLLVSASPEVPVERYRVTIYGFIAKSDASRFIQDQANAWHVTFRENWG